MQVYQAAGSGFDNANLVRNVIGMASFTYDTTGVTIAAGNHGIATSAYNSASGSFVLSWAASKYGSATASVPAVFLGCDFGTSNAYPLFNYSVASNAVSVSLRVISAAVQSATQGVRLGVLTAAETAQGHLLIVPYSASGTSF